MAIKIDNDLLQELGLASLPDTEKNSLLRHIYEKLEMNVGMRLADQMTNEQLDEFEQYFDAKDDAGAFKWLETNFPNYKDIVQQEFDKLKAEIARDAQQILAVAQQAPLPPQPQAAAPAPAPAQSAPQFQQPPVAPMPPAAPAPAPAPAPQPPQSQQPPMPPMPPAVPAAPAPALQQPDWPQQQPPAGPGPQPQ